MKVKITLMSSKLDPFFSQVFHQLMQEGLSYRTVCKSLLASGVEISPQALRSWYVRRVQKISSRTTALPPGYSSVFQSAPVGQLQTHLFPQEKNSSGEYERVERVERVGKIARVTDFFATEQHGPLAEQIRIEEQKLSAPAADQKRFLLRKSLPSEQTKPISPTTPSSTTPQGNFTKGHS